MAGRRKPIMMSMDPVSINMELSEPTIIAVANWVRDTTLLYGGSISTAFLCAAEMARGLEAELRRREAAAAAEPR